MEGYCSIEDYIIAYFSEEIDILAGLMPNINPKEESKLEAIQCCLFKRGITQNRDIDYDYLMKNIKWRLMK